ncbi:MAG: DUF2911 domain-containing protein [Cytophagales bacterium]|nr:MAG: DUF2911 domain-containing protein [Cytophagales bacterium]TAF59963.1 MAG: DUF2911 domain-containing protein [Cytophagales bacterium]
MNLPKPTSLYLCLVYIAFWFCNPVLGQDLPRSSPGGQTEQIVGLTKVKITYGRPSVKGRTGQIWGKLVPYGSVWRTGANEATVIEFEDDVKLGNKNLKAGKYALLTVPQKKGEWLVILNKDTALWGVDNYDATKNEFTASAQVAKNTFTETMTFEIGDLLPNSAVLIMRWENLALRIPIEVYTVQKAQKNILKAVDNAQKGDWQVFARSANYYKDNKLDTEQALQWIEQAIVIKPEHFYPYWVKAELLAQKKDYVGAVANANKALEIGIKAEGAKFTYKEAINKQIMDWNTNIKQ